MATCRRPAFTLIETLVATSIAAMTGLALLLGVAASIEATDDAYERTAATGIAQQLLDEISTMRYMERGVDPRDTALSASNEEQMGPGRSRYDDIDDYSGWTSTPPTDRWGIPLGKGDGFGSTRVSALDISNGEVANWRVRATVQYVSEHNHGLPLTNGTSWYRRATVVVTSTDSSGRTRELARLSRVFAYVPEP